MSIVEFETLATGYGLIEGPRVDQNDNLYFSDVTKGGVYRRAPIGSITTVVPRRRGVGGIALHVDGGLVLSGRNVCHVTFDDDDDGAASTRIVYETDAPGLNDLFAGPDGRVFVGTLRADPFGGEADRATGELLRIEPDGSASVLYEGVALSNGIGFSPDDRVLYHSDTANHRIVAHDVDGDEVSGRRVLYQAPRCNPDGLAVDEAGTVWVADYSAGRVLGISPEGDEVASIAVPAKAVTSLCFGGADRRDLYVVSADNTDDPARRGSVFRARVEVPGLPAPMAKV